MRLAGDVPVICSSPTNSSETLKLPNSVMLKAPVKSQDLGLPGIYKLDQIGWYVSWVPHLRAHKTPPIRLSIAYSFWNSETPVSSFENTRESDVPARLPPKKNKAWLNVVVFNPELLTQVNSKYWQLSKEENCFAWAMGGLPKRCAPATELPGKDLTAVPRTDMPVITSHTLMGWKITMAFTVLARHLQHSMAYPRVIQPGNGKSPCLKINHLYLWWIFMLCCYSDHVPLVHWGKVNTPIVRGPSIGCCTALHLPLAISEGYKSHRHNEGWFMYIYI